MADSRRPRSLPNNSPSRTLSLDNADETDIYGNPDDSVLPTAVDGLPTVSSIPPTTSRTPRRRRTLPSIPPTLYPSRSLGQNRVWSHRAYVIGLVVSTELTSK
ncbi:hypothetical protein K435DRAFT_864088 [Dendrothele bispora CBS 962.96]|uniref:Uncharacterized protein n=1 Tax=Dendrothele bispora (strain CBS 962.96) TaxID=1314807 RepID=A0A4S8LN07_DENBC|nr:hypothetical protein K435DRAFT_864088 [Dendrothele bispora CBS 962.96]